MGKYEGTVPRDVKTCRARLEMLGGCRAGWKERWVKKEGSGRLEGLGIVGR